jgi:hypothetical protein
LYRPVFLIIARLDHQRHSNSQVHGRRYINPLKIAPACVPTDEINLLDGLNPRAQPYKCTFIINIHINCFASVHINDNSTWCLTKSILTNINVHLHIASPKIFNTYPLALMECKFRPSTLFNLPGALKVIQGGERVNCSARIIPQDLFLSPRTYSSRPRSRTKRRNDSKEPWSERNAIAENRTSTNFSKDMNFDGTRNPLRSRGRKSFPSSSISREDHFRKPRDSATTREDESSASVKTEMKRMAAEFADMKHEEQKFFPGVVAEPRQSHSDARPSFGARSATLQGKRVQSKSTQWKSEMSKPAQETSSRERPPDRPKEWQQWKRKSITPQLSPASKSPSPSKSAHEYKHSRALLYVPIISEHSNFICINKPPAVLSQPGLPGEGTILELLQFQRRDLRLQTVNR